MRYYVTIDDQTLEVDLAADGIRVNGKLLQAELLALPGSPVRRLSVQGHSHIVHGGGAEGKGVCDFHLDGERYLAQVVDERTHTINAMTGASTKPQGPRPVKAPMPGLITRVEVKPGDSVGAGQGVAIIEAMKMENELKAETPGIVKRVLVEPGTVVEKGTVLIEFEEHGGA